MTNLENNLANEERLCLSSFLSLCVLENFNILFIKNKTFYELCMNDTEIFSIIYQHSYNKNQYGLRISKEIEVTELKCKLFKIDNIEKPIKAFSAYKLEDLLNMYNKLVHTNDKETLKPKNKKDLYDIIIKHVN